MNLKTLALLLPILSISYVNMSYAMESDEKEELKCIRATTEKNVYDASECIKTSPLLPRESFLDELLNKQFEISYALLAKLENISIDDTGLAKEDRALKEIIVTLNKMLTSIEQRMTQIEQQIGQGLRLKNL